MVVEAVGELAEEKDNDDDDEYDTDAFVLVFFVKVETLVIVTVLLVIVLIPILVFIRDDLLLRPRTNAEVVEMGRNIDLDVYVDSTCVTTCIVSAMTKTRRSNRLKMNMLLLPDRTTAGFLRVCRRNSDRRVALDFPMLDLERLVLAVLFLQSVNVNNIPLRAIFALFSFLSRFMFNVQCTCMYE